MSMGRVAAERRLSDSYGWRQWNSLPVAHRETLIDKMTRPRRAPGGVLGDTEDTPAIGDLPLDLDQTAPAEDHASYGSLPSKQDFDATHDANDTTAGQALHVDPSAMAAGVAPDQGAPPAKMPGLVGLRSAAGLKPPQDTAPAQEADVPLPPERPADLGGLAPQAAPAPAQTPDDSNPFVRAGNTVSSAITHGVQGAGQAVGNFMSPVEHVFAGLIGQESGGHQLNSQGSVLTSNKGAMGIAQVLPATGQMVAQQHGIQWDPNRFASDPQYNANLGKLYLQDQFDKYGDISKALAAYNAGPGRVDSAVRKGGDNWMAYMPSETQNYVPSILRRTMSDNGANSTDFQANADNGDPSVNTALEKTRGYTDDYGGGQGVNRNLNQQQAVAGAATEGGPNWFDKNRSWMLPLLSGIGGMASSNSRYLGSAILQGMGAGAQAYGQERQNEADLTNTSLTGGQTAANTGLTQAHAGMVGAQTADQLAQSLGHAYFTMGTGPNGPIPGVHAVLDGKPVDLDLGQYRRLQQSHANVRPQTLQEMSGGASANFGAQSGPVGIPPNQPPRPEAAGYSAAPPTAIPAPGAGMPSEVAPPAPHGANAAAPAKGTTDSNVPLASGEISYGVNYDPKAAQADGSVLADPDAQRSLGERNTELAKVRNAAQVQAQNAPLMREQLENTAAMSSAQGMGAPGAGSDWRYRVVNGLNTAARAAGYTGPLLANNDTQEQLAVKYRNMQSFANDRSDATLHAAMQTYPDLSQTPETMRHVQALNMTRAQYARDYGAFVEHWMRDNPDATLAGAQAAFTAKNPPSKYDAETGYLAGIMANPPLVKTLRNGKMDQMGMEKGFQRRMHLPSGMSRYFTQ